MPVTVALLVVAAATASLLTLCQGTPLVADIVRPGYRTARPNSGPRPPAPEWARKDRFSQTPEFTSFTRVSPSYRIYHNLWFHNARWYAILPPDSVEDSGLEDGLSPNNPIVRMPVKDLGNFTKNLRLVYVHSNTLMLDFPFQSYPEHLGHWLEMAVPMYNVLRSGEWTQHVRSGSKVLSNVVLPNLNKYFNSWISNVMAIAWGPGGATPSSGGTHQPNLIDYASLDGLDKLGWALFQDVVVVQDRYTHPERKSGFLNPEHGDLWRYDGCDRWVSPTFVPSFASPQLGHDFRAAGYVRSRFPAPRGWVPGSGVPPLPEFLTLLVAADEDPGVENEAELSEALRVVAREVGLKFRSVSLTPDASFPSHLDTAATSAVIVARHAPILASSVFLPPGAMVLELLPFKWEWHKISMMYYNMTQSIGDIHHFAWRPTNVEAAVYRESYARRYKDWFPGECHAKECLQVQAKADVIVDVEAVQAILRAKLPDVLSGKSIEELAEPWPEAV